MKRLLYIILLAFLLTACGKAEEVKKDNSQQVEVEEEKKTTDEENVSDAEDISAEGSEEDSQSTADTTNARIVEEPMTKPTTGTNNTKSATKPNTGSTNNNSSSTNNSGSTGNTTQTPTRKPVKRVSEEVKSAEVAYKYGITKYDVTTNYYTLYSDDSKELLDSDSYTVYNSSNYSATDSQLKSEADSNASKYMGYYQEVLRLVNEIRAEAGVAPLTLDTTLCKAASMRALEMDYSNEMSHTRPNGKDCFSVLDFYSASFGTCGENIAAGQTSASSVVSGWKNSLGHYENMVNPSYTKLGVGYSATGVGDYGYYWCQLFSN